ncbi:helix-turn-helix domain-containing protein [Anaerophilus nitritogenes]|uniref:helix-turn-helix domain-containing protein n=1 Tax=Anaerophilus nitritogenes TaxID=2498136 RepID=UPI002430C57F|nr:helix-turn-helix transcriptional regulator [Anaerophilus nitritogenes]
MRDFLNLKCNLKDIRKKHNMSLDKLSEISNVSKSTLSDIENNIVDPKTSTVFKITIALDIKFEELFEIIE